MAELKIVNTATSKENKQNLETKSSIVYFGMSGTGKTTTAYLTACTMLAVKYPKRFTEKHKGKNKKGNTVIIDYSPIQDLIGIIDTEHSRSYQLKNKVIHFNGVSVKLGAPKVVDVAVASTNNLKQAKQLLVEDGVEIIILDGGTDFWEWYKAEKQKLDDAYGAQADKFAMANWNKMKPDMEEFANTFFKQKDVHMIVNLRSKAPLKYRMNDKGREVISQGEEEPDFKASFLYDVQALILLDINNKGKVLSVPKDFYGVFLDGTYISPKTGSTLMKLLNGGLSESERFINILKNYNQKDEQLLVDTRNIFYKENNIKPGTKFKDLNEFQLSNLLQKVKEEFGGL